MSSKDDADATTVTRTLPHDIDEGRRCAICTAPILCGERERCIERAAHAARTPDRDASIERLLVALHQLLGNELAQEGTEGTGHRPRLDILASWRFTLCREDAMLVLRALGGRLEVDEFERAMALGDRLTLLREHAARDAHDAAKRAADHVREKKKGGAS